MRAVRVSETPAAGAGNAVVNPVDFAVTSADLDTTLVVYMVGWVRVQLGGRPGCFGVWALGVWLLGCLRFWDVLKWFLSILPWGSEWWQDGV